jgi:hypothetical protein
MSDEEKNEELQRMCNEVANKILKYSKKEIGKVLESLKFQLTINESIYANLTIMVAASVNMLFFTKTAVEASCEHKIDMIKLREFYLNEIEKLIDRGMKH